VHVALAGATSSSENGWQISADGSNPLNRDPPYGLDRHDPTIMAG
jgi:hypothetical protein